MHLLCKEVGLVGFCSPFQPLHLHELRCAEGPRCAAGATTIPPPPLHPPPDTSQSQTPPAAPPAVLCSPPPCSAGGSVGAAADGPRSAGDRSAPGCAALLPPPGPSPRTEIGQGVMWGSQSLPPMETAPPPTSMTLSLLSITRAKVWLRMATSCCSSWALASRSTARHWLWSLWRFRAVLCCSWDSLSCVWGGGEL